MSGARLAASRMECLSSRSSGAEGVRSGFTEDENKREKKGGIRVAVRQVRLIWFTGR